VEADGSVYFNAPAMRAVMFVLLDKRDRAIKRMRSFTTFMPGETISCLGCHERRTRVEAPAVSTTLACRRAPSTPQLPPGTPRYAIVDYPRDVQPILDKHCVRCHHAGSKLPDLSGGATPRDFLGRDLLARMTPLGGQSRGNDDPYAFGSGASKLLDMLQTGHHDVQLTESEFNLLRLWIDTGMWQHGTHAAMALDRHCGFAASDDPVGSKRYEAVIGADLLQRHCDPCHTPQKRSKGELWRSILKSDRVDLSTIDESRLLLAPLAKSAGGLGLCRDKETVEAGKGGVFTSKDDPDYQLLRKEIEVVRDITYPGGFHWEAGFRTNPIYVREMKRYGVLGPDVDTEAPLDPWLTDQTYYELFYPECSDIVTRAGLSPPELVQRQ
jgi:hypothetical protein